MPPFDCFHRVRRACAGLAMAGLGALGSGLGHAAPFVPADDAQFVESLPRSPGFGSRAQRNALRAELKRRPADLPLALQAARQAIDRARQNGDPRELGQAQAALAPWWSLDTPPAAVRLLRATVRQSQHDFEAALADLEALLQADAARPTPLQVQAQADLTRSAILRVQGRYAEAAAACQHLAAPRYAALGPVAGLMGQVCAADVQALTGQPQAAAQQLRRLARAPEAAPLAGWIAIVQAELADRSGDPAAAALYQQALQAGTDAYTLAVYADWLLDHQRAAEVEPLLQGHTEADALLLRQAIAWRRLGDGRAHEATARLQARFDAARRRGDTTHRREEALFALHLRGDAPAALALARDNWALQREPADARLLWEAARSAGDADAAEQVRRFQRETGLLDVRLPAPGGRTGQRALQHAKVQP